MATYPAAVKSFSTKVAGGSVQPTDVNDLQEEAAALETDLLKAWTAVAFNAGDFTASTGTWTVGAPDVVTCAYHKIGRRMTVSFDIEATDVSATPAALQMTIPGGFTAAKDMRAMIQATDAGGTPGVGMARVAPTATVITFYKDAAGGNWSAGANTAVRGQLTFETTT